jgi:hypothetical protein
MTQTTTDRPAPESPPVALAQMRHNHDVAWETFAPETYWAHNYRFLREDDRTIIDVVGAHFSQHYAGRHGAPPAGEDTRRIGLDVGSGSNLYPAMTMLPWSDEIVLTEYSAANCGWLEQECARPREQWRPFWQRLVDIAGYPREFPSAALGRKVTVRPGNVLELPVARYSIGTMFFVAESMTNYENEFEDATESFLSALKPQAPFAATFMDKSEGYLVGEKSFPAVREVTEDRVRRTLQPQVDDVTVRKIDVPAQDPLRDGYDGMIVAVGTR